MRKAFIILAYLGCSSLSFAGTMGLAAQPWQYVATFSAGPVWSKPGQTQSIYFSPTFLQSYVATNKTVSFASGELFLGIQADYFANLTTQLGLAIAATTAMQLKGEIWQDNDPDFNNFFYKYKISHSHVAFRGKVFKDINKFVMPYVGASLGVAFNRAYHYVDVPKIPEVVEEPAFHPNTTSAFTYALDAGLQRKLTQHWSIGVGYEFADWGRTGLSAASDQVSGQGLILNHVYTHELQFNLSYIA